MGDQEQVQAAFAKLSDTEKTRAMKEIDDGTLSAETRESLDQAGLKGMTDRKIIETTKTRHD